MEEDPKARFLQELRRALNHLYDPTILADSPLLQMLKVEDGPGASAALRRVLGEAIRGLKPGDEAPPESNLWRIYHILSYRYLQQFSQGEVALDLGLSTRQLRRLEARALQVLGDALWHAGDLSRRVRVSVELEPAEGEGPAGEEQGASWERELERLKGAVPSKEVDLGAMIEGVLETLGPLVQRLDVAVERDIPQELPAVTVQGITMRQALFSVIAAAVSRVPGGRVALSAGHGARQVSLDVIVTPGASAAPPADAAPSVDEEQHKSLEVARRLIEVSGGSLALHPGEPFQARAVLPAVDQVAVLGIDDNSDTLRLLQRYLSGTRYRFVGTTDPRQALPLAEQWAPRVILLDVMLPEIDGWELLSRLREHPRTQHTPIVVCTVLPQPELASLLGAAEFLPKPFSQETLLATLDRYANAAGVRGAR